MIASALAEAGAAKVYIAGRRAGVLDAAVATIGATTNVGPDVVVPIPCDVTSEEGLAALVAQIEKEAGFLNLLLCNSGIAGPQVPAPVVCEFLFSPGGGGIEASCPFTDVGWCLCSTLLKSFSLVEYLSLECCSGYGGNG